MKSKRIKISTMIVCIAIAGYTTYSAQREQINSLHLTLENIEALGQNENDPNMPNKYPAYKGEDYRYGNLKRYRASDGTCHFKNMINDKSDGYCRNA